MREPFDGAEALDALIGAHDHSADVRKMAAPDWSLDLPSAPDEERAVLGAMLLSAEEAGKIAALLEAEDFSEGKHARLFQSLKTRLGAGKAVDGVSLASAGELGQSDFAAYVDCAVQIRSRRVRTARSDRACAFHAPAKLAPALTAQST